MLWRCEPGTERFWSCPNCAERHHGPKPTATEAGATANQDVDDLKLEFQQLRQQWKADVVELKSEVEKVEGGGR